MANYKKTRYSGIYETLNTHKFYYFIKDENGKNIRTRNFDSLRQAKESKDIDYKWNKEHKNEKVDDIIKSIDEKDKIRYVVKCWLDMYKMQHYRSYNTAYYNIKPHILDYFKDMSINDLFVGAHLHEYYKYLIELNVGTMTKNSVISYFRRIMAYAFNLCLINQQQVGLINLTLLPIKSSGVKEKLSKVKVDYYTEDMFNQLIEKVDDPTYKLIFTVLFYCGLRSGELLALTPKALNYNDNTITIDKHFNTSYRGLGVIEGAKSINGVRVIRIRKTIMQQLKERIESFSYYDSEYIFTMSYESMKRKLKAYCNIADLPVITPHKLRHSFVSNWVNKFNQNNIVINWKVIAEYTGDKEATIMSIYSHLSSDAKQNYESLILD